MAGRGAGRLWSVAFGRSSLSPLVFTVRPGFREAAWSALEGLGVSPLTGSGEDGLGTYDYKQADVPDGLVLQLDWHAFTGYPRLPKGMWVVGVRPLYLLIRLLKLTPPTRPLKGVPPWDSSADLEEEARVFAAEGAGTDWPIAIEPDTLRRVTWGLLGDDSLVPGGWLPDVSGSGEWGRLGFNRREEHAYAGAGITPAEAFEAFHLGVAVLALPRPLSKALADAAILKEEGCPQDQRTFFLTHGGLRVFREFKAAGFAPHDASRYIWAGASVSEAQEWRGLGLNGDDAFHLLKLGKLTVGDARRALASGKTLREVAEMWREHAGPAYR